LDLSQDSGKWRGRFHLSRGDACNRLRDQQRRLREERHDYNHDPYFYTAPIYRYNRGGMYYETNQYGADLLRQAVNSGYQEGFRAGAADREDNWRPDYRNSYAYQDATYGYNGYYVDPEDYRYYFREGFQRGADPQVRAGPLGPAFHAYNEKTGH